MYNEYCECEVCKKSYYEGYFKICPMCRSIICVEDCVNTKNGYTSLTFHEKAYLLQTVMSNRDGLIPTHCPVCQTTNIQGQLVEEPQFTHWLVSKLGISRTQLEQEYLENKKNS